MADTILIAAGSGRAGFTRWRILALLVLPLISGGELYSQTTEKRGLLASDASGRFRPAEFTEQELRAPGMLCIRSNNYWCVKSPLDEASYWTGQVSEDSRGHSEFTDPLFGARAFARLMHTYRYKHDLETAREILSRYAPSTDTIGSIKGNPPNPTAAFAASVARSVNKAPDDPLDLFNADGTFNRDIAVPVFQAFSRFELSARFAVEKDLILEAIRLVEREDDIRD